MIRRVLAVCGGVVTLAGTAAAQNVPSAVRSAGFLEAVATRGLECDLLAPWEASALRALNLEDMRRWDDARRELLPTAIDNALADRGCEDEAIRTWIDAASKGFEQEMLPPYLVVYRALAAMSAPPELFVAVTTRLQYQPAIDAITAMLDALEAAGAVPDGGGPWPEFITKTEAAAMEFAALLDDPDADEAKRQQAAGWIAQAGHIVELWLLEQGGSPSE